MIDASLLDNNSYSPIPSNSDFQLYADGASNTLLDSAKDVHTINDSGTPDKKPITPTTFDVPFKLKVLHSSAVGLFSVADIDGDGKNDIIIAGGKAALHWLKHPSLQSYTIASSGSYEMEIQSFDVDSDGDVDVLGPDNNSGTLVWFENPRPGGDAKTTPWKRHEIGTWPGGYPHDFKIGDVNKDKRIDAVICPNEKSPFYLFVQNQPDTWDLITVNGASGVEGTWLGDIDGDGDDDITDGRVWIESPADPQKGPWETHVINQFPHAMKRTIIADINADGRMDVVTADAEFGEGVLAWYEAPANPREVNWKPHELVAKADHNFHTLQVGDINRDGTLDILVGSTHYLGNNGGYVVRIFYNVDGKGMTWKEQSWKTQYGIWQGVLADVGSDGDLDLLSANYQDGKTQQEFWENTLVP